MFHPIYQLYLYTYIYHQNDTNSNGNDQDKNNNYNNKSSDDNADHGVYIYIIYHQISTAQHGLESTAPLNSQDLSRQEIREGAIRKCRFWSKWNPGDINRQ